MRKEKKRLNIVIDKDLKIFIKDYAVRHDTTVTELIRKYFLNLRKRDVPQL